MPARPPRRDTGCSRPTTRHLQPRGPYATRSARTIADPPGSPFLGSHLQARDTGLSRPQYLGHPGPHDRRDRASLPRPSPASRLHIAIPQRAPRAVASARRGPLGSRALPPPLPPGSRPSCALARTRTRCTSAGRAARPRGRPQLPTLGRPATPGGSRERRRPVRPTVLTHR